MAGLQEQEARNNSGKMENGFCGLAAFSHHARRLHRPSQNARRWRDEAPSSVVKSGDALAKSTFRISPAPMQAVNPGEWHPNIGACIPQAEPNSQCRTHHHTHLTNRTCHTRLLFHGPLVLFYTRPDRSEHHPAPRAARLPVRLSHHLPASAHTGPPCQAASKPAHPVRRCFRQKASAPWPTGSINPNPTHGPGTIR